MKIYGYPNKGLPAEEVVSDELAEITLCATSDELRKIAAFLELCAKEMEHMGLNYDHVHLSDRVKEFGLSPHFVVAASE